MSRGEWIGYLTTMVVLSGAVAATTFGICRLLGAGPHTTLVLTTQTPILFVVALWLFALILGPRL